MIKRLSNSEVLNNLKLTVVLHDILNASDYIKL
jgi:hypothetical protein